MIKIIQITLLSLIISGCSSVGKPEIKPTSKQSSDAYFQVKLGGFKTQILYNAYIAPINPKKPDEILYKDLIKSSYPDAGPLGLLGYHFMNLPPGKYRIVAFNTSWNNEQFRRSETIALYLSNDDMKKTEFEISQSQLKVLGRFNFDYSEFSGNLPFEGKLSERNKENAVWDSFQAYSYVGQLKEHVKDKDYMSEIKERLTEAFTQTEWEYLLKNFVTP